MFFKGLFLSLSLKSSTARLVGRHGSWNHNCVRRDALTGFSLGSD